jgi:hypothetical protein
MGLSVIVHTFKNSPRSVAPRARAIGLCVAMSALGTLAPGVHAQCTVPDSTITALQVDASDASVRSCAQMLQAAFAKDDRAVEQARKQVLGPLTSSSTPSVSFRLAYDSALLPMLRTAAAGENEHSAINALVIAGELGTVGGINLLTQMLADPRPAVRMAAAAGLGRTMALMGEKGTKAPVERDIAGAVSSLNKRIASETDPMVLLGLVSAMCEGTNIPATDDMPAVAGDTLASLAMSVGDRASLNSDGVELSMMRAAQAMISALTKGRDKPRMDRETNVFMARFAGDALALARKRVVAGLKSDAERAMYADLVKRAENILSLVSVDGSKPAPDQSLGESLAQGNDKDFQARVELMIGSGGVLTKSPFNFPVSRFAAGAK